MKASVRPFAQRSGIILRPWFCLHKRSSEGPGAFHYTRATSRLLYLDAIRSVLYASKPAGFVPVYRFGTKSLVLADSVPQEGSKEMVCRLYGLCMARLSRCGGLGPRMMDGRFPLHTSLRPL